MASQSEIITRLQRLGDGQWREFLAQADGDARKAQQLLEARREAAQDKLSTHFIGSGDNKRVIDAYVPGLFRTESELAVLAFAEIAASKK